jgi:hypothetical protein
MTSTKWDLLQHFATVLYIHLFRVYCRLGVYICNDKQLLNTKCGCRQLWCPEGGVPTQSHSYLSRNETVILTGCLMPG